MYSARIVDSYDVFQCTRMFKDVIKIKGTPEGPIKPKGRARRLLGMATRRIVNAEMSPSADKQNEDIGCNSCSSSPQKIPGSKKIRIPLEDCDPNSQDSGYGASFPDKDEKSRSGFQFVEPLGVAPRRLSVESRSPMQSPVRSSPHRMRCSRPSFFRSMSSGYESMDDGFNDLIDMDTFDEATQLPNGISSLLSGQIVSMEMASEMECEVSTTPEKPRKKISAKSLRRSLSLQSSRSGCTPENCTPPMSKVRSCLFRSPNATSSTAELGYDENPRQNSMILSSPCSSAPLMPVRSFKRPEPPTSASPKLVKRSRKSSSFQDIPEALPLPKPTLHRSFSESEAHAQIKSAIHRSTTDADLTGDFSKPCILPLAEGQHEDLKSISAQTLAALVRGEYSDQVSSFKIVDCRYPYEYEGGHIKGAMNLYNKDLVEQFLLDPLTQAPEIQPDSNKRNILVFHCEFSWERGPNLSRFLRSLDRQRNKEHYPALHYPEVYLLHGGYEQFFKYEKELCTPQDYRPMRHPDHEADLRKFRSKSKSWQGERSRINGLTTRTNLKRLGF